MSRLAACEACRKAKLACDHKQPVCSRCANTSAICIYRTTPFKRRKIDSPAKPGYSLHSPEPSPSFSQRRNPYPNPGYLGLSSHAAIFKHITQDGEHGAGNHAADVVLPQLAGDNHLLLQGADILRQIVDSYALTAMKELVQFWLAKGVNLALAEPFVQQCAESVSNLFTSTDQKWHLVYARRLLQNSALPLKFTVASDISSFSAQFLSQRSRWETLAIFFTAVSRATIDIPFFPSLYTTEEEQYALRRLSTKLSDFALEISLSLDCLNDLQLIIQYENFIVHSYVDGDQSYHTWRKLGDVISSTFALGYHENVEAKPGIPPFLMELRKTAFARIYSADKNIAIFLGRPPRMNKRFCHFQIPSCRNKISPQGCITHGGIECWDPDAKAGYRADSRWSALCASLKEEIWELLQEKNHASYHQNASEIRSRAETHWKSLPAQFRLDNDLKQCTQSPFERDFLAGVRLQHLHVLFLLHLLLLNSLSDPDLSIIDTATQTLALVVETILLRDQLTNSGTGLIWKVAHYGLPSAGIILLAMLKPQPHTQTQNENNQNQKPNPAGSRICRTKTLRDLNVLVAEVQVGTIVRPGDPNYALLSKATQTIQRFLDSVHADPGLHIRHEITAHIDNHDDTGAAGVSGVGGSEDWAALLSQDLWDFEAGFWQSLADHPSLSAIDPPLPEL